VGEYPGNVLHQGGKNVSLGGAGHQSEFDRKRERNVPKIEPGRIVLKPQANKGIPMARPNVAAEPIGETGQKPTNCSGGRSRKLLRSERE
jgi:hypothetical protein